MSEFGKVTGHKVSTQKSMAFLYTNNELSETEVRKNPIYYSNKKNKVRRNKFNQGLCFNLLNSTILFFKIIIINADLENLLCSVIAYLPSHPQTFPIFNL